MDFSNTSTHDVRYNPSKAMDEQQQKALLKSTFDSVSGGYDGRELRFFKASAQLLAEFLELRGDERVLDVATGTGNEALAIAPLVPRGRVTGVDFSAGMLQQARRKAASREVTNIEFLEMDMQELDFPPESFDAATCAFGIFFVNDMEAQIARIAAVVRPGGKLAISGFQEPLFHPLVDIFIRRLKDYGVEAPEQGWKRIASEEGCRRLFTTAGISDIKVKMENVGYYLESAEDWWNVIWNGGLRRLVSGMPPETMERFKREHMGEIEAIRTEDGIWLDVGVICAVGKRP